jgi:pimeloyl-ACP methyl ester carboxylesterase
MQELLNASALLSEGDRRRLTRGLLVDPVAFSHLKQSIRAIQESWPDEVGRASWSEMISGLRLPTLLLWGAKDTLISPDRGFELIRRLPDASFYLSKGSGHWPMLDAPQWVITKMKGFLARVHQDELRKISRTGA